MSEHVGMSGITRRELVVGAAIAGLGLCALGNVALAADDHATPDAHIYVYKYIEDGDTTTLSADGDSTDQSGVNPTDSDQTYLPNREATRKYLANVQFAARRIYSAAEQAAIIANGTKSADDFVDSVTYTDGEVYTAANLGTTRSDLDNTQSWSGFKFLTSDTWYTATTNTNGFADIIIGQDYGTFILIEDEASSMAAGSVTVIEPCVVNIPVKDENGEIQYTVTAYPKNKELDRRKKIALKDNNGASSHLADAATYAQGDVVSYVVDGELPANVDNISYYRFVDVLDNHLDYVTNSVVVSSSSNFVTTVADVTFVYPNDYDIAYTGQTLTVSLHKDAIQTKLIDEGLMSSTLTGDITGDDDSSNDKTKRTRQVRLYFEARLRDELTDTENIAEAGDYPNTSKIQLVNSSGVSHEVETNTVDVYNLKITINKKDPNGNALAGAKFGIADSYAHAAANPPVFLTESMAGEADSTESHNNDADTCTWKGVDTGTTANDGTYTFTGLPFDLAGGTTYWVREIEAPDGYGIVEEPVRIDIGNLDAVKNLSYAYSVDVTDSPEGFLPNTGGVKSYAAMAAGAAVIAGGVGAAVAVHHHNSSAADEGADA